VLRNIREKTTNIQNRQRPKFYPKAACAWRTQNVGQYWSVLRTSLVATQGLWWAKHPQTKLQAFPNLTNKHHKSRTFAKL